MQDPSIYSQIKPQFPEQEQLKCPRCDSINTKFCYYNNYNLSQPRHFCKNCRRYWTKGGTLRNIPVGGGSRKNTKRPSTSKKVAPTTSCSVSPVTSSSSSVDPKIEPFVVPPTIPGFDQTSRLIGPGNGPFSSLLASNMPQFGNLLEALNTNYSSGPGPGPGPSLGPDADAYVGFRSCGDSNSLKFGRNLDSDSSLVLGPANSGCWKISRSPKSVSGLGTGSGLDSDSWKIPRNPNSVSGLGTDSGLESNHENGNTTCGGDFNHPKRSNSPNAISGLGTGLGSDQSGNNTYLDDSNCWNGSNGNWPDLAI